MSEKIRAAITAVGHYVPPDILDNAYFTDVLKLDTSDEWIRTRTGIVERHVLKSGPTSDLAVPAIEMLLKNRGIAADEIDCIVFSTVTPDRMFPPTAVIVQERIGAKHAWGFDIEAACSSFLFALTTGATFIESGRYKKVLVVGADKMTSIVDYTDRNNCILFGDAGACVLLEPTTEDNLGILDSVLRSDGSGEKYLHMEAGGSLHPPSHETVAKKQHYVYQDGKAVFKVAVIGMADVSEEIMKRNNLKSEDVSWLVPHQANQRIIKACAERMGLDMSKVMLNIDHYGNTTSATIPLCLSQWWHEGKLKKGMNIVLASFGAGFTWGATYVKWAY
ncbi:MAG TPA: beta-ketoacyl-ACP synthase III [Candidatus Kapabacteria bacterium]|nr:beta-ketoacyl-ACP synthase III [Candidatus Kapabacteria bacterium]